MIFHPRSHFLFPSCDCKSMETRINVRSLINRRSFYHLHSYTKRRQKNTVQTPRKTRWKRLRPVVVWHGQREALFFFFFFFFNFASFLRYSGIHCATQWFLRGSFIEKTRRTRVKMSKHPWYVYNSLFRLYASTRCFMLFEHEKEKKKKRKKKYENLHSVLSAWLIKIALRCLKYHRCF